MAEFKYEVVKKIGVLSQGKGGWVRELNLVSWGEREPKYDIRDWSADGTKMGKGVSLTAEELAVLKEILEEIEL
ncbi:MAG: PC4/YdbC family ssDNA-binding protein [Oscillospiraceae bacterium]